MITLKLQGGLGNQMFIYAFAKTLEHMGYEVCLDARVYNFYRQKQHRLISNGMHMSIRKLELLDFNLTLPLINQSSKWVQNDTVTPIYLKVIGKTKKYLIDLIKRNKTFSEQAIINNNHITIPKYKDIILDGYFCNVNYFLHIKETLQQDFALCTPLSKTNETIKEEILQTKDSCFIHIRRGDYLAAHNWMFVKLGKTYYQEAIKLICKNIKNPTFFIFSNDIQWCKNYLLNLLDYDLIKNKIFRFVDNNSEGNASEELELMRSCQNGIIANSTFSWWAAFLQNNPTKTIVIPNKWLYSEDIDSTNKLTPSHSSNQEKWYVLDECWGTIQGK